MGGDAEASEASGRDVVTVTDHGAARVVMLNRPEARNAIDVPTRRRLMEELRRAAGDPGVRAIVLTGAGGTFSAGGDVRSMEGARPDEVRARLAPLHEAVQIIATCAKPVIAAVEGAAAGLGVSFAAVCDHVVAAEDARFVAGFGKVGLVPDGGLLWSLPQRVGMGRAKEMLVFGRTVPASRAYEIGLADSLVPSGKALDAALDLAAEAAALAPLSVAAAKRLLARTGDDLGRLLESEGEEQAALFGTADFAEGRAAFAERRPPRFEGR
ncbi:enoyl-CoA hydratase/isomerase family protein [Actinomadura soli]|uniref:Enoyl-CoA hydratase/isomerase family protein n=1 Tax=Actinomadura soli TaxID=2508997 RepID=A0A5C4J664_9ACTN|nr:enoyl-CoA hydratase-related protein [Actinomadura soli]TMQ91302.1 enoyl-CoA hydratase/isomerase family protein [Actinomadura soli]